MTLSEASKTFKIPIKAIRELQKDGYIKNEPLTKSDIHFLACIRAIWCKDRYLQLQLAAFSAKRRFAICVKAPENERYEKWILSRYLHSLSKGQRLSIETVVQDVVSIFKIPDTPKLRKTILRIRKKAYNLYRRMPA